MRTTFFLCFLVGLLQGCSYMESYNSDPLDPRLPEYTAFGANAAGAYVDDTPWRTVCTAFGDECIGRELSYNDSTNKTVFLFPSGNLGSGNSTFERRARIRFVIDGNLIEDLIQGPGLFPVRIALDGTESYGEIWFWNGSDWDICSGGVGEFYVRELFGDFDRFVVAGTFGFVIDNSCGLHRIESGRYDFRFNEFF